MGNSFLPITGKVQTTKEKAGKLNFVKIRKKNVYVSKETTNKIKNQSTEWEGIFPSYIYNKGLESRTQKEDLKLS